MRTITQTSTSSKIMYRKFGREQPFSHTKIKIFAVVYYDFRFDDIFSHTRF